MESKVRNTFLNNLERIVTNAKALAKEKGVRHIAGIGVTMALSWPRGIFYRHYYGKIKSPKTFKFRNDTYEYFYHESNNAWANERTVEIPIVSKIMKNYDEKKILEVGNVISHYFPINHDVLDKYEKAERGVINQDAADFQSPKKYDLIVSISTFEHIGWDEKPREPGKILRSLENLKNALNKGGKIVITVPMGHNADLDKLLNGKKIPFSKAFFLKRISSGNEWTETEWNDIRNAKYDTPYKYANGLVVGIIEK